jgi:glycosyltransferase involved in cell wall biosynthesis
MHFCFLLPQMEHYSPVSGGAIATVTVNVCKELQSLGQHVDVIASDCCEPLYNEGTLHLIHPGEVRPVFESALHFEARFRGWDAPHEGRFYAQALTILKTLRPDVVVLANDLRRIAPVRRAVPSAQIVSWLHNECGLREGASAQCEEADAFLCCSEYIRNWLLRQYQLDQARVHTALAGVDHERFYPSFGPNHGGNLRVLFTGRLDQNKGVDIAVDTVSKLREQGVPIQLSVAGNAWFYQRKGREKSSFQDGLRKAMKESGSDWLGHVPRRFLPEVMRGHDLALVLSRSREPFGLVVLEAMASGLAVIASPRGGLMEACGGAAMLVDPENSQRIADLMEILATDPAELMKWRDRSRQRSMTARWSHTAAVLCGAVGARRDRNYPVECRGRSLGDAAQLANQFCDSEGTLQGTSFIEREPRSVLGFK